MTPAEAAALLAVAAAFDNRKPDADAAQAWAYALEDRPFIDCRDAIVAHYRHTNDWLMPNHVIAGVRKIRDKRLDDFGRYDVPDGLDSRQTLDFLRATNKRIADGEITSAVEIATPGLKPRDMPDLQTLMPSTDDDRGRTPAPDNLRDLVAEAAREDR